MEDDVTIEVNLRRPPSAEDVKKRKWMLYNVSMDGFEPVRSSMEKYAKIAENEGMSIIKVAVFASSDQASERQLEELPAVIRFYQTDRYEQALDDFKEELRESIRIIKEFSVS